jgi:hypothetical protein
MVSIFNKTQCDKVYTLLKQAQLANWNNGENFTTQAQLDVNAAIVKALNAVEVYDKES